MDQQLKERLIGALVLAVLAVILIPTVLDGPDESSQIKTLDLPPVDGVQNGPSNDTPVQSYHFDLDGKSNTTESETATPQQQQQAIIDASPVVDQPEEMAVTQATEAQPEPAVTQAPVEEDVAIAPEPAPEPTNATGDWAIQVGSFSKKELAQRLADDLEKQGYRVFLMEFTTGGITYHRVRIGPFTSEETANQTAKEVHQKTGGPAKVVSN